MRIDYTNPMVFLEQRDDVPVAVPKQSVSMTSLRAHPLLGSLDEEEFSALISTGCWMNFSPDEVVSRQSMAVDVVLFIVEGRAKAEVSAPAKADYKAVINFLGPGDDIGLLSLVDGGAHSASVTSLEELKAIAIPMGVMREHLRRHREWYRSLAETAVTRLRTSGVWLQALI